MQIKKQLKRILAFVMAFTFIVSTQVHAADGESSALMDMRFRLLIPPVSHILVKKSHRRLKL